jgi:hypothetical protein
VRGGDVSATVKGVAGDLIEWKKSLGDLEKRTARVRKELERCRRMSVSQAQIHKEQVLKYKLDKLETQQELFWKQRAHVNWLKNGDRNSKYFHSFASERKRVNRIKKLKKYDGSVVERDEEMAAVITNYFNSLFTQSIGNQMQELLAHVVP